MPPPPPSDRPSLDEDLAAAVSKAVAAELRKSQEVPALDPAKFAKRHPVLGLVLSLLLGGGGGVWGGYELGSARVAALEKRVVVLEGFRSKLDTEANLRAAKAAEDRAKRLDDLLKRLENKPPSGDP